MGFNRSQEELEAVIESSRKEASAFKEAEEAVPAEEDEFEPCMEQAPHRHSSEGDDLLEATHGVNHEVDLEDQGNNGNARKLKCIVLVVFLLAVLAAIFLPISFTKWKNNGSRSIPQSVGNDVVTLAPSPAPTPQWLSYILDLIVPFTPREVLLDDNTPQGRAFLQLVDEAEATGEQPVPFRVLQRYALMALFFSTNGENWENRSGWNNFSENECFWHGVDTCRMQSDGSLAVSNLNLASNLLSGTIPKEICILGDALEKICLGANAIEGTIPDCVVQYRNLIQFDMGSNLLSGGLPPGLLTIPTLETVELYNNALSGGLDVLFDDSPGAVAAGDTSANSLVTLRLESNVLNGTVPEEFSSFVQLEMLFLNGNELTGTVDREVCSLASGNGALEFFEVDCMEVFCDCCPGCLTRRGKF